MRSTLKKSLYLGLAALSFASVAGAANNADAAKKTKPAKTYATASYQPIADQGQSNIAYNVTGSNALFNKPGTVKGAKQTASKATMSDLASSKQNFMVYQTATTNRGSKYIKVVSFDKQYRGWIYAGNNTSSGYGTGVQQVNLTTSAASQYSNVYLKNPGNVALKTSPEGSQFNASQNSFAQTGFVANDRFTVDGAQTVNRTGTTWYHLTDQYNNSVNGWVPSDQVQLTNSGNYFDARNQIKLNYVDGSGQVVKSSNVTIDPTDINYGYSGNYLNSSNLATKLNNFVTGQSNYNDSDANNTIAKAKLASSSAYDNVYQANSPLRDSGYTLANAFNSSSLNYVTTGSTVNVPVQSDNNGNVSSKLLFRSTSGDSIKDDITVPSLDSNQTQALSGSKDQYINAGSLVSDSLFTSGGKNNSQGNTPKNLYTFTGNSTLTAGDTAVRDNTGAIVAYPGQTYHKTYTLDTNSTQYRNNGAVYGGNFNLYYTVNVVSGSGANNSSSGVNTNYAG